jgi:hypothetical protein
VPTAVSLVGGHPLAEQFLDERMQPQAPAFDRDEREPAGLADRAGEPDRVLEYWVEHAANWVTAAPERGARNQFRAESMARRAERGGEQLVARPLRWDWILHARSTFLTEGDRTMAGSQRDDACRFRAR